MREFIEQLKLYKEFIAVIFALVGAALFIANYFATKDALKETRDQLNALVTVQECQLGNRITVADASASIVLLEREQIDNMREKIDLQGKTGPKTLPIERAYAKERLEKVIAELSRIEGELKDLRSLRKQANDYVVKNSCTGMTKKTGAST